MKKILIVEDDEKIAKALNLRMSNAGYSTNVAADAIQGICRAAKFLPDLVLLDINLPGGSGIEVAQRLRSMLPNSTPIIFLTASKNPHMVERAATVASPVRYVEKPYHPEYLMDMVAKDLCRAGAT